MPPPKPQERPATLQKVLLVGIVLAITLGPRLRIGALEDRAIDVRLQDLLLPVALATAVLFPKTSAPRKMRIVWGDTFAVFAGIATLVILVVSALDHDRTFRVVAFAGRQLEPFILAMAVAALMVNVGPSSVKCLLHGLHISVAANGAWVLYQMATGLKQTIFGDEVSELIGTYGPKLVGEPSTFSSGFYFAFMAAVAVAEFRSRITSRRFALALLAVAALGAHATQSRISLAAVVILGAWLVLAPLASSGKVRSVPALYFGLLAVTLFVILTPDLGERFRPQNLARGFGVRTDLIWAPLIDLALTNPWGLGPGALGTDTFPAWTEAHNIFLRAALDWGILGMVALATVFFAVWRSAGRAQRQSDASTELLFTAALARAVIVALVVTGSVQDSTVAVMSSHLTLLAVGALAATLHHQNRQARRPERDVTCVLA